MTFQLHYKDGSPFPHVTNKVVCVGQNYHDHIEEMGSVPSKDPVLFLKPATALCDLSQPIQLPNHGNEVHHEIELAVIIGKDAKNIQADEVETYIGAYALAIDLTIRDVQAGLKKRGHPWDIAKAFDDSCPISHLLKPDACENWQDVEISLSVNGEVRQSSSTALMIHKINPLIAYMSSIFTLEVGDIVLCGTPAGVGPLINDCQIVIELRDILQLVTFVGK